MTRYRYAFCMLVLFLTIGIPAALAETVTIEKELLEKILKRQEALEHKVQLLEKKLEADEKTAVQSEKPAIAEDVGMLKEDVDEMAGRLDVVERKSILDKVQIGGELRTRLEWFNFDSRLIGGKLQDTSSNQLWSNRVRLNLRADITDELIFRGRFSYFKFLGNTDFNITHSDYDYPSIPDRDGQLHVEQAYVDYFIPKTPLSFTFGRLPTVEGPPNELRNLTTRKATWPRLMTDAESDGIIANLSLEKWTGFRNSMFRVGYSKINQNYLDFEGEVLDDNRILALAFETAAPWVKDSMFWMGYLHIEDVGALRKLPDGTPVSVISHPSNAGDWDLFNTHLQFNDIRNSGVDWFGSFAWMHISTPDEGTVLGVTLPTVGTVPVNEVGVYGDSLNGDLGEDHDGYAFYTGLRYELPLETLKYPRIGFEYNYGSKYWIGTLSSGSGDIINKLNISGHGYELYYIQPIIDKHMFCRLGAIYLDYDYYNSMSIYGSRTPSDMTLTNLYFLADIRF